MTSEAANVIKPLPPGFQRNMIILTSLFVSLMAAIDLTIVTVALPYMAGSLNATPDEVTWVVTMFAVGQAIVIGITGHLSRMLGRKVLVLTAVIGFVASSAACGLAQDLDTIVLFRFVQGLFSGPLVPLSQSMLIDAVEEKERAKIMSYWIIGVMGGPAIGPLLGGYLAQDLDWRWNFWVNLPVGAVAVVLILSFVRRTPHIPSRTDWLGLAVLFVMLSSLQIALNQGDKLDWFSSHTIVYLLLIAVVAAMIFFGRGIYLRERNIVDITLFGDLNYALCCIVISVLGCAFLGLMILTPILFVDLIGWEPSTAGLVIGCYGVGGITGSIVSGRLQAFLTFPADLYPGLREHGLRMAVVQRLEPGYRNVAGRAARGACRVRDDDGFAGSGRKGVCKPPADKRDEGAGLFNLTKTLGFSFGTTAVGSLYYSGQLSNWSRYVGDITPSNSALMQYLDSLGFDGQLRHANGLCGRFAAGAVAIADDLPDIGIPCGLQFWSVDSGGLFWREG